jgi:hypothetical protein
MQMQRRKELEGQRRKTGGSVVDAIIQMRSMGGEVICE